MFDLTRLLNPSYLIGMAILFLTSMPIHEWAHAWAAYQLGDDTASLRGRLTLNPLAHLDPVGTFTLLFLGFGWGKPVPVSPYRLRGNMRTSMMLVGAAGPFSNLVMAMLAAIPLRLGWLNYLYPINVSAAILVDDILYRFIFINLGLMLFNLIPIVPLDGSRILAWLLPPSWANVMDRIEQFGGMGLMLVLYFLSRLGVFSKIVAPLVGFMISALGV